MIASQTREEEIAKAAASEQAKQPKQRATLPPTTIALNCQRLRQAYSSAELAEWLEDRANTLMALSEEASDIAMRDRHH